MASSGKIKIQNIECLIIFLYPKPQLLQQLRRSSAEMCALALPFDAMQMRSDMELTAPNACESQNHRNKTKGRENTRHRIRENLTTDH